MMSGSGELYLARCNCGNVIVESCGTPIMTVACYCESCQKAGHHLELLPDAPGIKHTIRFMWNLMKAWAAMGFKTPKVDYVN